MSESKELLRVGTSYEFERTITETDVGMFASISGDRNPLHLSDSFASKTPFGRRVVHGALVVSLISAALTHLTGPGYVYLGQEVTYRAPVFIGDTLSVAARVNERREDKPILSVVTEVKKSDGTLVIEGKAGLMKMELEVD